MNFFSTLLSIVAAVFLMYFLEMHPETHPAHAAVLLTILATGCFFVFFMIVGFFALPLQKASVNHSSRVLQLVQKDQWLWLSSISVLLFPVLWLALSFRMDLSIADNLSWLLAFCLILFGMALDLFFGIVGRLSSYLNPYFIIEKLTDRVHRLIRAKKITQVYPLINALNEIGIKGGENGSAALAREVCDKLPLIAEEILQIKPPLAISEANYALFYILGEISSLYKQALDLKEETLASRIMNTLGKLVLASARYDMSLAVHPLPYVGKFARQAFANEMDEVPLRATFTLEQVAKLLMEDIKPAIEIKQLFLSINHQLEEIAKETFRQDKKTNLKVLAEPFHELKKLFSEEKMASHLDSAVIVSDLDRIIGDFTTLETVLKTMPPIPNSLLKEEG